MGDRKAGLAKWETGGTEYSLQHNSFGYVGSAREDLEGSLDKHTVSLISYFSSHSYLPGAKIFPEQVITSVCTQYCLTDRQKNR